MRFRTKNTFYLRISIDTVVPLYLYLHEKHVEWMSEYLLNTLLEDLRQAFNSADEGAQLRQGLGGKKTDVTIRKRDTYQYAYFFRKGQPHSVVFKTRNFIEEKTPEGKGKAPETSIEINDSDDREAEEEEKPKLKMQVSYQGLTVTEKCLCIIMEPLTGNRTSHFRQRTLEETGVASTTTQKQRDRINTLSSSEQQGRERTPLFLPDLDLERSTPATFAESPSVIQRSIAEFGWTSSLREEEGEESGLHTFGETLNSIGDDVGGDIDDDDDDEGEAFLGDADDRKNAV